jgi:hypothetical protein
LCVYSASSAEEAGGKHTCVVKYNEVVRSEQVWKIAELGVAQVSRAAIQMQKAGRCPVGEWFLGDEVFRKCKIEIGNQHDG